MSAETPHPYISTLPQETINILAKNRDIAGIDKFIYRLQHDLEFDQQDSVYKYLIGNPKLKPFVNEYIEHAQQSGKINQCINYLRRRNPDLDNGDSQEVIYFAIWRSFFVYPWEKGYIEKEFNTYLYRSIRWLTRDNIQHRTVAPFLEEGILIEGKDVPIAHDAFLNWEPENPEKHLQEKEELKDLIKLLVEKTTNNQNLENLKTATFTMLALNIEPKEIAELLQVNYARLKTWIRSCKDTDIIDTTDRIEVNVNGTWQWNQKNAQVILKNIHNQNLLTKRELKLLNLLSDGESYMEIVRRNPDLDGAENNIAIKIKSYGEKTRASEQTYLLRRKQMMSFLNNSNPVNDEEKNIVNALRKSKGNIDETARKLKITRGKVMYFLKQKGYYDK